MAVFIPIASLRLYFIEPMTLFTPIVMVLICLPGRLIRFMTELISITVPMNHLPMHLLNRLFSLLVAFVIELTLIAPMIIPMKIHCSTVLRSYNGVFGKDSGRYIITILQDFV